MCFLFKKGINKQAHHHHHYHHSHWKRNTFALKEFYGRLKKEYLRAKNGHSVGVGKSPVELDRKDFEEVRRCGGGDVKQKIYKEGRCDKFTTCHYTYFFEKKKSLFFKKSKHHTPGTKHTSYFVQFSV